MVLLGSWVQIIPSSPLFPDVHVQH